MSPIGSSGGSRRKAGAPLRKKAGAPLRKQAGTPLRKKAARKASPAKPATPAPPTKAESASPLVRLNKFLADRGVDSRRKCDELITEGKVTVNGESVTELGHKVDTRVDTVEVAGFVFRPDEQVRKRYYLLNKPAGVVCTNERRELRPRAVDLVTDRQKGRIYTVGRLDEESKGLVLLTNDGEFAHRIMHPRHGVPKTYGVKVRGPVDDEALAKVRQGVYLAEGRTGGARVIVHRRTRDYTHLLVTLFEGKNREVRRVFAHVGAKVAELKRVRIGNLTDKGLKIGSWRPLLRAEVRELIELSEGIGIAAEPTEPRAATRTRAPVRRPERRAAAEPDRPSYRKQGGAGSQRPDARGGDGRPAKSFGRTRQGTPGSGRGDSIGTGRAGGARGGSVERGARSGEPQRGARPAGNRRGAQRGGGARPAGAQGGARSGRGGARRPGGGGRGR